MKKNLWKWLLNKIITVLLLAVLLFGGIWYVKQTWFGGDVQVTYDVVVKQLTQKQQLVVAEATLETRAEKRFDAAVTKDWPDWMAAVADVLISRKAQLTLPVKTAFKLELAGIRKEDLVIEEGVLRFKRPLIIHVDSQKVGDATIAEASTGLVDKVVDVVTGSQKALEFLEEKSQELVYETSEALLTDKEQQKKVVRFASRALEDLLVLNSDEPLQVDLTLEDVIFQNSDRTP